MWAPQPRLLGDCAGVVRGESAGGVPMTGRRPAGTWSAVVRGAEADGVTTGRRAVRPVEAAARRKASADSATRPAWSARVPISNQTCAASRSAPTPVSVAIARRYQAWDSSRSLRAPSDLAQQEHGVDADQGQLRRSRRRPGERGSSAPRSALHVEAPARSRLVASAVGGAGLAPVELGVGDLQLLARRPRASAGRTRSRSSSAASAAVRGRGPARCSRAGAGPAWRG